MYLRRLATAPRASAIGRTRCLTTTTRALAHKDAQHKDDLKPETTENTKSGSDQDAAHADKAFDPNKTRPESEGSSGKSRQNESSLDASPANHEFSKPKKASDAGEKAGSPSETGSGGRQKSSGGGSAPKSGGKHSG